MFSNKHAQKHTKLDGHCNHDGGGVNNNEDEDDNVVRPKARFALFSSSNLDFVLFALFFLFCLSGTYKERKINNYGFDIGIFKTKKSNTALLVLLFSIMLIYLLVILLFELAFSLSLSHTRILVAFNISI